MSKNLKIQLWILHTKLSFQNYFFSILAKHLVKMLTNMLWSLFGEQCNKKNL
jgi:hypothetical protein